ncbi:jg21399 [Pararge aegeria aegeria]|uniref:Jg21399 protein n=1 Tax=Pararge aegeria aegeria TaxID=348720 RepID=A0A8S4RWX4_9NEOP|nr:jg21399 [Pararge aegeria aegeria]
MSTDLNRATVESGSTCKYSHSVFTFTNHVSEPAASGRIVLKSGMTFATAQQFVPLIASQRFIERHFDCDK